MINRAFDPLIPTLQVPLIRRRLVRLPEVLLAVFTVAKILRAARPGALVPVPPKVNGVEVVRQVTLSEPLLADWTVQVVGGAGRQVGGGGGEAVDGGGHLSW